MMPIASCRQTTHIGITDRLHIGQDADCFVLTDMTDRLHTGQDADCFVQTDMTDRLHIRQDADCFVQTGNKVAHICGCFV